MSCEPPRKRARFSNAMAKAPVTDVSPLPNDSQTADDTPKLFTLPAELQTMIYEYVLSEPKPIHIKVAPAYRTVQGKQVWRTTVIIGNKVGKPPLLHASRHLRNFATPLFFSINTFSSMSEGWANNATKRLVLRQMWGEHVRKINSIEYSVTVRCLGTNMDVSTRMEIVKKTSAVELSRRTSGTRYERSVPKGQMCVCALKEFAASLDLKGKGAKPLYKIAEECSLDDYGIAHHATVGSDRTYVKTCDRCGLPDFANLWRMKLGLEG